MLIFLHNVFRSEKQKRDWIDARSQVAEWLDSALTAREGAASDAELHLKEREKQMAVAERSFAEK